MKRIALISFVAALTPLPMFARFKTKVLSFLGKPFKVGVDESRAGEPYFLRGITMNRLDLKISGADTEGGIAVFEQTGMTPNGGPPVHLHPGQDEWFYVIEGEYMFKVGEEKFFLKSGETIFLPRNVPHGFIQLSEKTKVIVSFVPAGKIESFFKATTSWTAPPSIDIIRQTLAEHDMQFVSPPLKKE